MIKKELRKINDLEKLIDELTQDEVEKYQLKEDFYTYDNQHKEGLPLFQNQSKPQHRILNSISDHELGSYDEYEQMQTQIKYMLDIDWKYNRIEQLKNQYIVDRRKIVMSKIKIKQIIHLIADQLDFNDKDSISMIIKSYLCTKTNENKPLYEFLDSIFNALDQEMLESTTESITVEDKKQNQSQGLNKSIFCEKDERNQEVFQIFYKLSVLLKPNFDQELQKEIQRNLNEGN